MDRDMSRENPSRQASDHFDQFRSQGGQRGVQGMAAGNQQRNVEPTIQRQYRPVETNQRRRVTANDLNDNDNSGSLWVQGGTPASLFSSSRSHSQGDIVLIDVYRRMRNEITLELQRAFPQRSSASEEGGGGENAQAATGNEADGGEDKAYDRISTVIVENVNRDHVLLRGRKYLIFRNRRRLVEVQALVSRRDITETDSVHSDKILESRIAVLR